MPTKGEGWNIKATEQAQFTKEQRDHKLEDYSLMTHVAVHGSPIRRRKLIQKEQTPLVIACIALAIIIAVIIYGMLRDNNVDLSKIVIPTRSSWTQVPQGNPGNATPVVNDQNSFPTQLPQPTQFPTVMAPTAIPTQIISAPSGSIGVIDPNWSTTPVATNSSNNPQPVSNVNLSAIPLYDGLIGSTPERVVCQYGSTFFYVGPGFRDVIVLTTSDPGSITIQTPWDWPGNATVLCPSGDAVLIVYAK